MVEPEGDLTRDVEADVELRELEGLSDPRLRQTGVLTAVFAGVNLAALAALAALGRLLVA
jgi:hypothetical protein